MTAMPDICQALTIDPLPEIVFDAINSAEGNRSFWTDQTEYEPVEGSVAVSPSGPVPRHSSASSSRPSTGRARHVDMCRRTARVAANLHRVGAHPGRPSSHERPLRSIATRRPPTRAGAPAPTLAVASSSPRRVRHDGLVDPALFFCFGRVRTFPDSPFPCPAPSLSAAAAGCRPRSSTNRTPRPPGAIGQAEEVTGRFPGRAGLVTGTRAASSRPHCRSRVHGDIRRSGPGSSPTGSLSRTPDVRVSTHISVGMRATRRTVWTRSDCSRCPPRRASLGPRPPPWDPAPTLMSSSCSANPVPITRGAISRAPVRRSPLSRRTVPSRRSVSRATPPFAFVVHSARRTGPRQSHGPLIAVARPRLDRARPRC